MYWGYSLSDIEWKIRITSELKALEQNALYESLCSAIALAFGGKSEGDVNKIQSVQQAEADFKNLFGGG